jgi:hypothetical protein
MHRFDKEQVAATIQYIVHLLSNGGIEQALRSGKPSRCAVEDLHAVLAEHGQRITLSPKAPKTYLTIGEGEPAELYADIRLCVDEAPSDLPRGGFARALGVPLPAKVPRWAQQPSALKIALIPRLGL